MNSVVHIKRVFSHIDVLIIHNMHKEINAYNLHGIKNKIDCLKCKLNINIKINEDILIVIKRNCEL